MADIIAALIDDAQSIIKEDREKTIKPAFKFIERFLAEHEIAVNFDYDDATFYEYRAYPMMNFSRLQNAIKEYLVDGSDSLKFLPYIHRYIYKVVYGNYEVVRFINIFWPHENVKYKFLTYEAPARLDSSLTMRYIHPKYALEEIYRRMYCPENFEYLDEFHERKNELIQEWQKLNPDNAPSKDEEELKFNFNKLQDSFSIQFGKLMIPAYYDARCPIFISSRSQIERIREMAESRYEGLVVVVNSSKSFFDPRRNNYIFKKGDKIICKVWELLDYDVIPVVDGKAHIAVLLSLALTEHITYEILGYEELAKGKLTLFNRLIATEKRLKSTKLYTLLPNCKFKGKYYPLDKYLATARTDEVVEKIHSQNMVE